jgi:hypothetical protein
MRSRTRRDTGPAGEVHVGPANGLLACGYCRCRAASGLPCNAQGCQSEIRLPRAKNRRPVRCLRIRLQSGWCASILDNCSGRLPCSDKELHRHGIGGRVYIYRPDGSVPLRRRETGAWSGFAVSDNRHGVTERLSYAVIVYPQHSTSLRTLHADHKAVGRDGALAQHRWAGDHSATVRGWRAVRVIGAVEPRPQTGPTVPNQPTSWRLLPISITDISFSTLLDGDLSLPLTAQARPRSCNRLQKLLRPSYESR